MKTKFSVKLCGHKMDQICVLPAILVTNNTKEFELAFAYVVYLWGEGVWSNQAIQCLIQDYSELDDARKIIKEKYNLEFSELCTSFCGTDIQRFSNITDDRDITLIVERVPILNVKKVSLS